jgi:hypothetical protein
MQVVEPTQVTKSRARLYLAALIIPINTGRKTTWHDAATATAMANRAMKPQRFPLIKRT